MDAFNYLAVLVSIVLGLSIAQLLSGFGHVIQQRARVRVYWPAMTWAGILLVVCIQSWWAMFALRTMTSWDFVGFADVLLHPITLFLACVLVFPPPTAEPVIDLRVNYYGHSRWFFGTLMLLIVLSLTRPLLLHRTLIVDVGAVFQLGFLGVTGIAAFSSRDLIHKCLAAGTAILMVAFIGEALFVLR